MTDHSTVSIIILTYNNLTYTRQCLESIFTHTDEPDYEVIVVDNASQDNTPDYLDEIRKTHPKVHVILNQKNEGFAKGNNIGAEAARGDYLVFLNNDTVVTEGWLKQLIAHVQDPGVGMVGPVTNSSANETQIEAEYYSSENIDAFAREYVHAHAGETFEIGMLPYLCVILRREVYEQIGPLDERFGRGMFEDDDYAMRLQQKGYRLLCAEDAFVHHWGSASFSRLQEQDYINLFEENRKKFEEKWNIKWQVHLYRPSLVRKQITETQDWARSLQKQVISLQSELDEIHNSTGWKMVRKAWDWRLAVFPAGSRRERYFKRILGEAGSLLGKIGQLRRGKESRQRISWHAYAFERYRQARNMISPSPLSDVHAPGEKGLVSIVLPVYNGERYIREAIDSILAQSYGRFEVIAVDDGSTDTTPAILDEFAQRDPHIRVLHQPNLRLPAALNTGFQFARGEFLTWTSADNRYKPEFLEKMVACLIRHPNWEMIYANIDLIDADGQPLRNSDWFNRCQRPPGSEHIYLPEDPRELNTYPDNYVNAAFLYRSRVSNLIGDYSNYRFGTEDYDYWMRVNSLLTLRHADFDDIVYEYRFHKASLTSRDKELGITKSRNGLMVFDDARRDFYLAPMTWVMDTDSDPESLSITNQIREKIARTDHLLVEKDLSKKNTGEWLWTPTICIYITNHPSQATPPVYWPESAIKVLLANPGDSLPNTMDTCWDLCVVLGDLPLPRLSLSHQGWLSVPHVDAFYSLADIRARSIYSSQLETAIAHPVRARFKCSAVICTYRRGYKLENAIRSVAKQTMPGDDYEVIVVNNDPQDPSVTLIVNELRESCFTGRGDRLRLIDCPFQGLSYARNAGISEAQGEIICFLDDDATAFPDWLEQIWNATKLYPEAGLIGGPVLLSPPEKHLRWLKPGWEHLWSHFDPPYKETRVVDQLGDYPYGANWCARRAALLQIGGFRCRYGRKGSDYSGGEEVVAASLIQKLGYQVVIAPAAKVYHLPDKNRFTFQHARNTIFSIQMTEYRQQTDLYFPIDMTLESLKKARSKHIKELLFNSSLQPYERLKNGLYAWSYARVLKQLRKDIKEMERLHQFERRNSFP